MRRENQAVVKQKKQMSMIEALRLGLLSEFFDPPEGSQLIKKAYR